MTNQLEQNCITLKEFVSQFHPIYFLGSLSAMLPLIGGHDKNGSLAGLSSPQRQLFYLGALNISSDPKKISKERFSDEEFKHMKSLLNEIERGYDAIFFPSTSPALVDDEWKAKVGVSMPAFLSYFNQGTLNYEEQTIERIVHYFTPFNSEIEKKFHLTTQDFIDIYNFIDNLPNDYEKKILVQKKGDLSWEDFTIKMRDQEILPQNWHNYIPENLKEFLAFIRDKGKPFRFDNKQLIDEFGSIKTENFISALSCERADSDFLFYTQSNPLVLKPIFKISDVTYQGFHMQHIIEAIFSLLMEMCVLDPGLSDKFYKIRGKKLEEKVQSVIENFLGPGTSSYKGYFTIEGHEQDLLFTYKDMALIVEVKSAKRIEPRRDPEKAYPLIHSNFVETIQYGYDQSYRVKKMFLNQVELDIFSDVKLKNKIAEIRTNKFHKVFSIIVTLERFGPMQTDLSSLLEIYEDDTYPWSICIDDLEVFFLQLKIMKKKPLFLCQFLRMRENLHGKLISADELEVCGAFLTRKLTYANAIGDNTIITVHDLAEIFDKSYSMGLGFINEKYIKEKQEGKYQPKGGF